MKNLPRRRRFFRVVEGSEESKGDVKDLAIDFLLYGALARNLCKNHGLQPRSWRIDARILHSRSVYSRTTRSSAARRRSQSARRSTRDPITKRASSSQTPATARSARGPVLESLNFVLHGADQKALGHGRQVRRRYADPLQRVQQLLRNGRSDEGRNDGLGIRPHASARASIPIRCTRKRVNGYDPLAVIDATDEKEGDPRCTAKVPQLLEVDDVPRNAVTPRPTPPPTVRRRRSKHGRSMTRSTAYRSKDRRRRRCNARQSSTPSTIAIVPPYDKDLPARRSTRRSRRRMDLDKEPGRQSPPFMFSNQEGSEHGSDEPKLEVLIPKEENPRSKAAHRSNRRCAFDDERQGSSEDEDLRSPRRSL